MYYIPLVGRSTKSRQAVATPQKIFEKYALHVIRPQFECGTLFEAGISVTVAHSPSPPPHTVVTFSLNFKCIAHLVQTACNVVVFIFV